MTSSTAASGGIDRNGDGVITTSTSGTDLKDVIDHGTLGTLDIADFSDERVAWVAVLPAAECGNLGRSLTLDRDGNIWIGTYYSQHYYKLSGADGSLLGGPYPSGATNYGAVIDANGILWGASLGSALVKMDTTNPTNHKVYNGNSNYGKWVSA